MKREFLVTKFVCATCGGNLGVSYEIPKRAGQYADGEPTGAAMVQQVVVVEQCKPCGKPAAEILAAARAIIEATK